MRLICLQCLGIVDPICDCGNAGILIDTDMGIHIYVEDIRTTRLAKIYHIDDIETYRELQPPFDTAFYIDYAPVKRSHLNFQLRSKKNDYVRVTTDQCTSGHYDKRLMKALDAYRNTTASPHRMGSTKQQPNKETHQ